MKNNLLFYALCIFVSVAIVTLNSCKKDPREVNNLNGTLKLSLKTDQEDQMIIKTIRSVPLNEYDVVIMTVDDKVYLQYSRYEEIPENISLEPGEYYVVAHSGNDSIAAFENPYLSGQSDNFTIGSSVTTSISVTCEIRNFGIKVNYNPNVANDFTDYYTVVKSGSDSLIFTKEETRSGYFQLTPIEIYSVLPYELTNGTMAQKIVSGYIESPEPSYLYDVTIDASSNGLQTNINLNLNEKLDTIDIEINDHLLVNDLDPGNLLITEIMYDPSNLSDTEGEWFEIFNNTISPINLNQLVISSSGSDYIVNGKIVLQPSGYYVFARADTACEVEKHIYSGLTLLNTSDDITLSTFGTDGTDGYIIATVAYDESGGFPDASGSSLNLNPLFFNFEDAQLSSSWCLSTDTFNTGDFGTPGIKNLSCN